MEYIQFVHGKVSSHLGGYMAIILRFFFNFLYNIINLLWYRVYRGRDFAGWCSMVLDTSRNLIRGTNSAYYKNASKGLVFRRPMKFGMEGVRTKEYDETVEMPLSQCSLAHRRSPRQRWTALGGRAGFPPIRMQYQLNNRIWQNTYIFYSKLQYPVKKYFYSIQF